MKAERAINKLFFFWAAGVERALYANKTNICIMGCFFFILSTARISLLVNLGKKHRMRRGLLRLPAVFVQTGHSFRWSIPSIGAVDW